MTKAHALAKLGNCLRWLANVSLNQWTQAGFVWKNLPSVWSYKLATCACLPTRVKPWNLVYHAQSTTLCLEAEKGNICLLEPSWIAVRLSGGLGQKGGQ
eukprot:11242243-Ditylum_brightwellii.AAC.1